MYADIEGVGFIKPERVDHQGSDNDNDNVS